MNEEEKYTKELEEAGVDVSDIKTDEIPEETAPPEAKPVVTEKTEEQAEEKPLVTEPKEQHKRSIYDEYKDKKSELKSERERADIAERERDELKSRLESLDRAVTPQEKQDAQDEIEAFAQEIGADASEIGRASCRERV